MAATKQHEEEGAVGDERALPRRGAAFRPREGAETAYGEAVVDALAQRQNRLLMQPTNGVGIAQRIKDGRGGALRALHLLELELVRPGDDRAPDELIGGDDDGDHHGETPDHGAGIAVAGRGLQVGTESGQAEVAIAEHEHLARHEKEPAAGDRDHGVPDQADGGEGQLQLPEALPCGEAVNLRGFAQLARNAADGGVEAEGHVPHLAGEDEQDGAHLHTKLARGQAARPSPA